MGVNRAFEEIIGKEREKLIGSFIYEFIPEEVIKKFRDKILKKKVKEYRNNCKCSQKRTFGL